MLRPLLLAGMSMLLAAPSARATAVGPLYVRAGVGFEESGDATVRDLDCGRSVPPALFGCGDGVDGRPLAARGDFGAAPAVEAAAGVELGQRARLELAVSSRRLDLEAEANFLGVAGRQPVRGAGRSTAALLVGAVDLAPAAWRVRPFVAAGVGVARSSTGPLLYAFPSLGPAAITRVRGGSHSDLAWTAAVGAATRLSTAADLEIAVRHTDLGELRTDAGEALIVRSTRTLRLDVAGSRADLETLGVVLSLRYRLGAAAAR